MRRLLLHDFFLLLCWYVCLSTMLQVLSRLLLLVQTNPGDLPTREAYYWVRVSQKSRRQQSPGSCRGEREWGHEFEGVEHPGLDFTRVSNLPEPPWESRVYRDKKSKRYFALAPSVSVVAVGWMTGCGEALPLKQSLPLVRNILPSNPVEVMLSKRVG